jgi:cold shock CspA family protein
MRSTVKWFNNKKGIGFILGTEEVQEDILVHYSTILQKKEGFKSLIKDEPVEFDLVKTKFGYRAKNVITIDVSSMQ